MNTRNPHLLKCLSISKYLLLILITVIHASCEKENSEPNQIYNFLNYEFLGNVTCYDNLGNKLDSLSYMYSQNDFTFTGDFTLPFEKIEIRADSTVLMYYLGEDKTYNEKGSVTSQNDTLFFYFDGSPLNQPLFSGLIVDNHLRILGYGYIYYSFSTNGLINVKHEYKTIKLGIPDIEDLIDEFPSPSIVYNTKHQQGMYLQKFDVVYGQRVE